MKIIAFGHQSRVGKDTAGKMLVSMLRISNLYPKGVQKRAFGYQLKMSAFMKWKQYGLREPEFYDDPTTEHLRKVKLPRINMDPVELWIAEGQTTRGIYSNTWMDAALDDDNCDVVVICDIRNPNEVAEIKRRGGLIVKVSKPDVAEYRPMDLELKDYTGWDHVLINDGSLSDLHEKVNKMAKEFKLL